MTKEQLILLKAELVNDPLGRGYSGMTNEQIAADLNTAYRSRNKESLSGQEMFYATVAAEYAALTDPKKSQWLSFCGIGEIDPFNAVVVGFVQYVFGVGSDTIDSLSDLRVETISRAQEGGFQLVTVEDIEKAKNNEDL